MGLFSILFGGLGRAEPLTEITEKGEEGWHDLAFSVQDYSQSADGIQTIQLAGLHKGKKVALCAILSKDWIKRPASKDFPITTYKGTITIQSVGAESDLLISVIDSLYQTKTGFKTFKQKSIFTGISLGGDPRHPDKGDTKIKLFYEPDDQTQYAELYFNILLGSKIVQIHEKDPEYRTNIVKALGSK